MWHSNSTTRAERAGVLHINTSGILSCNDFLFQTGTIPPGGIYADFMGSVASTVDALIRYESSHKTSPEKSGTDFQTTVGQEKGTTKTECGGNEENSDNNPCRKQENEKTC